MKSQEIITLQKYMFIVHHGTYFITNSTPKRRKCLKGDTEKYKTTYWEFTWSEGHYKEKHIRCELEARKNRTTQIFFNGCYNINIHVHFYLLSGRRICCMQPPFNSMQCQCRRRCTDRCEEYAAWPTKCFGELGSNPDRSLYMASCHLWRQPTCNQGVSLYIFLISYKSF